MGKVPHINISIDENDINNGATKILKVLRPTWKEDNIEFKLLTDGITNKLVGCKLKDASTEDTVLVRVYGNKTELLIDRAAETRNIILLNKEGLAPNLYATFNNGLAYKFVPGETLTKESVRDPKIYRLVAEKMANLHKVKVSGKENPEPYLWNKMDSFLKLVPDVFSDSKKQKLFEEIIPSKSRIEEEIAELKQVLTNLNNSLVFAHNDLLLGNVIYTDTENKVTFIDYEYADFNYQGFDIGNHFAEFVGVSDIDYRNYPEKKLQLDWIQYYLREYMGEDPTDVQIEKLYIEVNQFSLATHILWGIWGLIQAEHSYIDFDFIKFAALRFNEYFARKSDFLSLELES